MCTRVFARDVDHTELVSSICGRNDIVTKCRNLVASFASTPALFNSTVALSRVYRLEARVHREFKERLPVPRWCNERRLSRAKIKQNFGLNFLETVSV